MQKVAALLEHCNGLLDDGADFPTIWYSVLKAHPLVASVPIQGLRGGKPALCIRLATAQSLLFRSSERLFSVD